MRWCTCYKEDQTIAIDGDHPRIARMSSIAVGVSERCALDALDAVSADLTHARPFMPIATSNGILRPSDGNKGCDLANSLKSELLR